MTGLPFEEATDTAEMADTFDATATMSAHARAADSTHTLRESTQIVNVLL